VVVSPGSVGNNRVDPERLKLKFSSLRFVDTPQGVLMGSKTSVWWRDPQGFRRRGLRALATGIRKDSQHGRWGLESRNRDHSGSSFLSAS